MAARRAAGGSKVPATGTQGEPPGRETEDIEGNASTIAHLYQSQSQRLLGLLRRRIADGDEARDMLQEIFVRVTRMGSMRMRDLDRPEAYLTSIAGNLIADRARRGHALRMHAPLEAEEHPSAIDPIRYLETRDMLARIEAAMHRLKPRTREIFLAHRLEGLSYGEIAERFGLSVKGVEKQMSKAIAQVDRMLDRR